MIENSRFTICARNYIASLIKEGRYSTAHVYRNAIRFFTQFCGTPSVAFYQINRENLKQYNNYLITRKLKHNTISTYMRMLRCIYNQGVDAGQAPYIYFMMSLQEWRLDKRKHFPYANFISYNIKTLNPNLSVVLRLLPAYCFNSVVCLLAILFIWRKLT